MTEQAKPNYLEMSDEELLKAGPPSFEAAAEEEVVDAPAAEVGEDEAKNEEAADDAGDQDASDADDEAGDSQAEKEADEAGDAEKEKEKPVVAEPVKEKAGSKTEKPTATEALKETPSEEAKVDYEAEYKRLLTPFKANGKEIAVQSVDDAIELMQMGAGFNKKMAALKPNLKLLKLLENNGLLSEEKIGFLLDLSRKDPAAINKLVKESGIDPMDLSDEKASAYKPNAYAVDDREIELDTVLDEISSTPTYTRTLSVVSNKWDAASKQAVAKTPALVKVINDHVASGIYDLIAEEVERERVFGRLNGVSDLEAYRQVGDAINQRGGFNHLAPKPVAKAAERVVVQPKPKQVEDDKLKDKKRAASSTKPAVSGAKTPEFNPLSMSDEEFSKQVKQRYL